MGGRAVEALEKKKKVSLGVVDELNGWTRAEKR
jgi:hypothetical protein